jgi:hypothetical protein
VRYALVVLLAACSHTPFATAPHTPLPQLDAHDGVVLANAQLVTITFPGYAYKSQVEAFGDFVGGSNWLRTVGAEYGVGPTSQVAKLVWPSAAVDGTTDQQLQATLVQGIRDGTLPSPPVAGNQLLYLVYWPSNLMFDATGIGASTLCLRSSNASFHSAGGAFTSGYHTTLTAPNGANVPYAVIADCTTSADGVTTTASRELIGALTNPYEVDLSGYLLDVAPDDPWLLNLNNGEAGYLCEHETATSEGGFALHRSWSNAQAAASAEPCVPADPGDVYMNVSASPSTIVQAAAGTTVTFTLTGWSTASTDDWTLDYARPEGTDLLPAMLQPQLSAMKIGNGATVTLTVKVPSTARAGQYGGLDVTSGPRPHAWPVAFVVK